MFGMEQEKRRKGRDQYSFDLENELKEPGKLRAYKEHIQEQMNQLKSMLRKGEDKKSFDRMQVLLQGYLACQKVLQRTEKKRV
jgi:hypothetical protein